MIVDVIETPRGFVPTIESIRRLVEVINEVLSELSKTIVGINLNITKILDAIGELSSRIKRLEVTVNVLQDSIIELKSNKTCLEKSFEKKLDADKTDVLKKKLLDLLED